jgi:hypothetical protein
MFGKTATFAATLAIVVASGCATVPDRDPALDDARLSLEAARRNPQVAMYAPVELEQAAATLRQADDLAAKGWQYKDAHQLALLANQRAVAAQDLARVRSEQAALIAQRTATDARIQADVAQRQAAAAQLQAGEAQRQAEQAQRIAAALAIRSEVAAGKILRQESAPSAVRWWARTWVVTLPARCIRRTCSGARLHLRAHRWTTTTSRTTSAGTSIVCRPQARRAEPSWSTGRASRASNEVLSIRRGKSQPPVGVDLIALPPGNPGPKPVVAPLRHREVVDLRHAVF